MPSFAAVAFFEVLLLSSRARSEQQILQDSTELNYPEHCKLFCLAAHLVETPSSQTPIGYVSLWEKKAQLVEGLYSSTLLRVNKEGSLTTLDDHIGLAFSGSDDNYGDLEKASKADLAGQVWSINNKDATLSVSRPERQKSTVTFCISSEDDKTQLHGNLGEGEPPDRGCARIRLTPECLDDQLSAPLDLFGPSNLAFDPVQVNQILSPHPHPSLQSEHDRNEDS